MNLTKIQNEKFLKTHKKEAKCKLLQGHKIYKNTWSNIEKYNVEYCLKKKHCDEDICKFHADLILWKLILCRSTFFFKSNSVEKTFRLNLFYSKSFYCLGIENLNINCYSCEWIVVRDFNLWGILIEDSSVNLVTITIILLNNFRFPLAMKVFKLIQILKFS